MKIRLRAGMIILALALGGVGALDAASADPDGSAFAVRAVLFGTPPIAGIALAEEWPSRRP